MFLKGLLFGVGWMIGAMTIALIAASVITLIDRACTARRKQPAQDERSKNVQDEVIAHAECVIMRLETMLDLLRSPTWPGVSTGSVPRRTFTVQ